MSVFRSLDRMALNLGEERKKGGPTAEIEGCLPGARPGVYMLVGFIGWFYAFGAVEAFHFFLLDFGHF